MAITDDNQTKQTQQSNQQPRQAEMNRSAPAKWSFHDTGLSAAPISRGLGSEFFNKTKKALTEIYEQAATDLEIAILDLDNNDQRALAFSSLVVAIRNKKIPAAGVAYHILMLEATGDKITPIYETINNTQVEVLRVTGDALDSVLLASALDKVKKAFPTGPWWCSEGTVVPTTFNPDDRHSVHRLALNTGLACSTILTIETADFTDLNLADISNDSSLAVNVAFNNNSQTDDAVGQPVRTDIIAKFGSKKNNPNNRNVSLNNGDKEVNVSEVGGYVTLDWAPVAPQNNMMNVYAPQMQQMQTQKYAAHLVLTHLASSIAYTPGSVLLALTTALSLVNDNNWIQAFRPSPTGGRGEIDIKDIGAINIEANLLNTPGMYGERIDTKADNFRMEDLGQLMGSLVQPGLICSIDCPESGPMTSFLSYFPAASGGNTAAYDIIYSAANRLTNGNFQRHFPHGSAMFTGTSDRIHLGTYTDKSGAKRDIRDIDQLAICNLIGERSPDVIRSFSDTYLRSTLPIAKRLHDRKKILSSLTNETAVFTGFAQRVTFSGAFLEALGKGIKDTGLNVRVSTPLSGSDFNNQRGVASFAQQGLMTVGGGFMSAGGQNYNGQYQQNGWTGLRW